LKNAYFLHFYAFFYKSIGVRLHTEIFINIYIYYNVIWSRTKLIFDSPFYALNLKFNLAFLENTIFYFSHSPLSIFIFYRNYATFAFAQSHPTSTNCNLTFLRKHARNKR